MRMADFVEIIEDSELTALRGKPQERLSQSNRDTTRTPPPEFPPLTASRYSGYKYLTCPLPAPAVPGRPPRRRSRGVFHIRTTIQPVHGGIAMARYTPEFLAALRQRYEETDQPMRALALEFEIGISTVSAIVEREGWTKRSQRQRGSPRAALLSEAQSLLAGLSARGGAINDGGPGLVAEEPPTPDPSPPRAPRVEGGEKTTAERLEALLVREIAAEEAARAELGTLPRLRAEADSCTRRLAVLTHTLKLLRGIPAAPAAGLPDDDDMPRDIDEFRLDLARRIDAFVASRADAADADGDAGAAPVAAVR
jgi:hypothetical protein